MIDFKNDVMDKLIEKGYNTDIETVEKVMANFKNALFMNDYWAILEQTIEDSGIKKPEVNIETVELGKEYKVLPTSYIKQALHNQRVKVVEIKDDSVFPVVVTILGGRMKGERVGIEPSILKIMEP